MVWRVWRFIIMCCSQHGHGALLAHYISVLSYICLTLPECKRFAMKAAPAVKTHARVSCVQREKHCFWSHSFAVYKRVSEQVHCTWYIYILDGLLAPLFSIFLSEPWKSMFFLRRERKRRRTNVRLLPSFAPPSSCDQMGFTLEPIAHSQTHFMPSLVTTVCSCLCVKLKTYTICSTPGKHSDADGGYTWLNSVIWELLCLIS